MASWPLWATTSCGTLLTALLALHAADRVLKPSGKTDGTAHHSSDAFVRFRRQYLAAYFLVMFADWLQGTHMYSLYQVRERFLRVRVSILLRLAARSVLGNDTESAVSL